MMRIGLGCVNLGSSTGPSERAGVRLVHAALDAGITLFDTADAYGSGASEMVLGRALRGRRDGIQIATKGGYCFEPRSTLERRARRLAAPAVAGLRRLRSGGSHLYGPQRSTANSPRSAGHAYQAQDFSLAHLRNALDESLRRLGTDVVDVYQLHGPGHAQPELAEALRELVETGKVRRTGIGAEDVASAASWVQSVDGEQLASVDTIQLPFGPLDPDAAEDVFPAADRAGTELWVRGVFGGGVFHLLRHQPAALSSSDHAKASAVQDIADELGLDLFELAVGFVRSFAGVSTIVLGTSTVDHLRRNVELVRHVDPLPDDIVRRITDAVAASRADHVASPHDDRTPGGWP